MKERQKRVTLATGAKALAISMTLVVTCMSMPSHALAGTDEAPVSPAGRRAAGPGFVIKKTQTIVIPSKFTGVVPLYKAVSIGAQRTVGNGKLTYVSSNPNIATVSSKGKVVGKAQGKATITITAAETGTCLKATKKVRVTVKTPAPMASAPKSASWFTNDKAYVNRMKAKVGSSKYRSGHKTNYAATVDCDKCRLTWFFKGDSGWVPFAGYNTIQGVRDTSANKKAGIDWGIEGRLVRSRSFKGAWRIKRKKASQRYTYPGTGQTVTCKYLSCYVPYGSIENDMSQRFEASTHGNPDTVTGNAKYASQGCCNVKTGVAKWIYEKIPMNTSVIVFDSVNPLPEWNQWDAEM